MTELVFIQKIEDYGRIYERKLLDTFQDEKLSSDWWEALKFVFSRTFMRGRRDELSNEYMFFTFDALGKEFQIDSLSRDGAFRRLKEKERLYDSSIITKFIEKNKLNKKNSLKHKDFNSDVVNKNDMIRLLTTEKNVKVFWGDKHYEKKLYLGNQEDIMMVLDILKMVSIEKNIYAYIKKMIYNAGIEYSYNKLNEIRAVGDKLSTFVLRDVCMLDRNIPIKKYKFVFPIDTWVNQIAKKIDCTGQINEIKTCLIKKCQEVECDPILFAAGLWYVGFNSLEILLEQIIATTSV